MPSAKEPDIRDYLSKAWELVIAEPVLLIVGFFIISLILVASMAVLVGPLVLTGPLLLGYYQVIEKRLNGQEATFEELFAGFQDFPRSLVAGLLLCAVAFVGFMVSAVAGIILNHVPVLGTLASIVLNIAVGAAVTMVTCFVMPAVALSGAEPMTALQQNFQFASKRLQPMAILGAVITVLGAVGGVACGIGIVVTVPMAMVVQVLAYHRYFEPESASA